MRNTTTGYEVWNGDAFELFFGSQEADQGGAFRSMDQQVILSAGQNYDGTFNYWWYRAAEQYPVDMFVREKAGGTGYVIEAAIPWAAVGLSDPSEGTEIRMDFGMGEGAGQGRISQYMWNCMVESNPVNRKNWGKAVLTAGMDATKEAVTEDLAQEKADDTRHRVLYIPKTGTKLTVDGKRDAAWPAGQSVTIGADELVLGNPLNPVEADIFFAWDEENLYVYAHCKDATPMVNTFPGAEIWNGDGLELFFGPNDLKAAGPLLKDDRQIIISGGLAEDGSVKY